MYAFLKEYDQWKASTSQAKAALSSEDRFKQDEEWDEKKFKIKKRMLGNVRFIGELYKKGLITTKTIHNCLFHLIGRFENDEWVGWKDTAQLDEQDLEILCKFLPTVGELMESKANDEQFMKINWFFERLLEISKDKTINSRIRSVVVLYTAAYICVCVYIRTACNDISFFICSLFLTLFTRCAKY